MNWWCSSSLQTWTWTPKPYVGSILIVLTAIVAVLVFVLAGALIKVPFTAEDAKR